MTRFHRVGSLCQWLAAGLLAVLPIIVALDYGGVLRWTQYMSSQAVVWIVVVAILGCGLTGDWGTVRQHKLMLPLLLWLGFALFQTVSLPHAVVQVLSSASANAYTDWINPYLLDAERLTSFPISIARQDSMHGSAILAVIIAIAWASSALYTERSKIALLLVILSLGASVHAGIGAWRLAFPESEALSRAFGTYINRNNAALLLNLGLGVSLGLVAWRLTALRSRGHDRSRDSGTIIVDLIRDRDAVIGLIGSVCCTIGILVGGSRGGLVAACLGLLLTLFLVRHKRGSYGTPVAILMVIAGVTFSLVPMNLKLESVERLEALTREQSAISGQNRLAHWRDGWNAAWEHLPAGSGLGTYAYAYLPFQEFSSPSWYHHADNLWLELITEQGVVGIVLTLAIFAIAIHSIRVLAESPDPIDHGLRTTGTFCLIAITVTQLFDFGLIVFGNLIAVTLLLPVLVARSSSVMSQHRADRAARTHRRFATTNSSMLTGRVRRQSVMVIGIAAVAVGLSAAAIPTLRQSARIEFLDREVNRNLTPSQFDQKRLANLLERLNASSDKEDSHALLLGESDVRYLLARLEDTLSADPSTPELFAQRYQETGPFAKRLNWAAQVNTADSVDASVAAEFTQEVTTPEYKESFSLAQRSLKLLPLNRRARTNILYLDFIPKSVALTQAALLQLEQLYGCQSTALIKIGRFAADSGDRVTAIRVWRQALILEPQRTALVLETIDPYNHIDVLEVLPESQEVLRRAARHLLREADEHQEALLHIGQLIDCQTCQTHARRSDCELLLGDVEYSLGHHEIAYEKYRQAIYFAPRPAELRQTLIARLENQGDHDAALAMRESTRDYDRGTKNTESTP